jgi:hypothetical protein
MRCLFPRLSAQSLGLALMLLAGPLEAQTVTHTNRGAEDLELQLKAIKSALVAAVDKAPIRVLSTAWVDAKGSLHESTLYNTDARIQGVRVLSYLRGETETPDQKIQRLATQVVLPAHLRKPTSGTACPASDAVRWRMPLIIEPVVHSGTGTLGHAVGLWLSRQIDHLAVGLGARSARWYAVPSSADAPPQLQGTYWQTYLGRPLQEPDWRLRIRLLPAPVQAEAATAAAAPEWVRAWLPAARPPGWLLQMVLQQQGREPVWQWQTLVEDGHPEASHAASVALQDLRERLPQALALLDRETECVAVQYPLRPLPLETGAVWSIAAGEGSRLRAGDRVLVFDRQSLPSRLYEPESMRRVALAEVTRAGPRHTELRQLAGPPLPLNGDWVAIPM